MKITQQVKKTLKGEENHLTKTSLKSSNTNDSSGNFKWLTDPTAQHF